MADATSLAVALSTKSGSHVPSSSSSLINLALGRGLRGSSLLFRDSWMAIEHMEFFKLSFHLLLKIWWSSITKECGIKEAKRKEARP